MCVCANYALPLSGDTVCAVDGELPRSAHQNGSFVFNERFNLCRYCRERVLLLNGSTWEPLSVISIPRAINLILSEKAITVEDSGKKLRTVNTEFPVPSVIALRRYVNVPRRKAHWSRRGVLVRDEYTLHLLRD